MPNSRTALPARKQKSSGAVELSALEERRMLADLHWTGAANDDFMNPGNWLENAAPNGATDVHFGTTARVSLYRDVSVNSLIFDPAMDVDVAIDLAGSKLETKGFEITPLPGAWMDLYLIDGGIETPMGAPDSVMKTTLPGEVVQLHLANVGAVFQNFKVECVEGSRAVVAVDADSSFNCNVFSAGRADVSVDGGTLIASTLFQIASGSLLVTNAGYLASNLIAIDESEGNVDVCSRVESASASVNVKSSVQVRDLGSEFAVLAQFDVDEDSRFVVADYARLDVGGNIRVGTKPDDTLATTLIIESHGVATCDELSVGNPFLLGMTEAVSGKVVVRGGGSSLFARTAFLGTNGVKAYGELSVINEGLADLGTLTIGNGSGLGTGVAEINTGAVLMTSAGLNVRSGPLEPKSPSEMRVSTGGRIDIAGNTEVINRCKVIVKGTGSTASFHNGRLDVQLGAAVVVQNSASLAAAAVNVGTDHAGQYIGARVAVSAGATMRATVITLGAGIVPHQPVNRSQLSISMSTLYADQVLKTAGADVVGGGALLSSNNLPLVVTSVGDDRKRKADFAPGDEISPIGVIELEGDLDASLGTTYRAETGDGAGLNSVGTSDLIAVTGDVSLAGELRVGAVGNSMSYAPGDHFDILTAETITGEFDNLPTGVYVREGSIAGTLPTGVYAIDDQILPYLAGGLAWRISYNDANNDGKDEVRLTVVAPYYVKVDSYQHGIATAQHLATGSLDWVLSYGAGPIDAQGTGPSDAVRRALGAAAVTLTAQRDNYTNYDEYGAAGSLNGWLAFLNPANTGHVLNGTEESLREHFGSSAGDWCIGYEDGTDADYNDGFFAVWFSTIPQLASASATGSATAGADSITLTFPSATTLSLSDLQLSQDGTPITWGAGQSLSTSDGGLTYQLTGLDSITAQSGVYSLSFVNPHGNITVFRFLVQMDDATPGANDSFAVSATDDQLSIVMNSTTVQTMSRSAVDQMIFSGQGGDDTLVISLPGELQPRNGIFFAGGSGTDRAEISGGDDADTITGRAGKVDFTMPDLVRAITLDGVESAALVSSDGADQVTIYDGSYEITGTSPFATGSKLEIEGGTATIISDLTNDGTILYAAGALYIANGVTLTNAGTYEIAILGDLITPVSGTATFINTGTIRKSAGTEASHILSSIAFANDGGTIDVQTGEIVLDGYLVIAAGSSLTKTGDGQFTTSSYFVNNGTIYHEGGTLATDYTYLIGQYYLTGGTHFSGGSNGMLSGDGTTEALLVIDDGTFTGNVFTVGTGDGQGRIIQNSGAVDLHNLDLSAPSFASGDAEGNYEMYGGTLDADGQMGIGNMGTGTFYHYGGAITVANNIFVGFNSSGTGTWVEDGGEYGTLDVGGCLLIGYANTGPAGSYLQYSGTVNAWGMYIGWASGSGTAAITGGTLNTGPIGNNGTLTQSGGTVNAGELDGSGSLTVTGEAAMTVNHVRQGDLTVDGGTLTIAATGNGPGLSSGTSVVNGLSMQITDGVAAGTFDLGNNSLVVNWTSTDPIDTLTALIQSAYASGAWTGTGLTSTVIADNSYQACAIGIGDATTLGITSFGGQTISGDATLVRYTLIGDANLDGTVDEADEAIVEANYQTTGTKHWYEGDFNYDGVVDDTDVDLMEANLGQTLEESGGLMNRPSFGQDTPTDTTPAHPDWNAIWQSMLELLA